MFNRKHLQLNRTVAAAIMLAAMLLSLLFAPLSVRANAADNVCGDGLTYSLTDGTLTVSGTGDMYHYNEKSAPWAARADEITYLVLENGVTSVGNSAFAGCERLTGIRMADSVRSISAFAFKECTSLSSIQFSTNLKYIYESAFEKCTSLFSVHLPDGLYRISDKAFYRCYALSTVTVPASVGYFGRLVFGYCGNLTYANVLCSISLLPDGTFSQCNKLLKISLPETVTETGENSLQGCDNLSTVYYPGTQEKAERLASSIGRDIERFTAEQVNTESTLINSAESWTVTEKDNGQKESEIRTVTETENSVICKTESTVFESDDNGNVTDTIESKIDIVIKIENGDGWQEAEKILSESKGRTDTQTTVNVIVETEKKSVPGSTLTTLAGEKTDLKINGTDGTTVTVDCSRLDETKLKADEKYDFGYTVSKNEKPISSTHEEVIGKETLNYSVKFEKTLTIDQSPTVYVGKDKALELATLYSQNNKELLKMQTVVIDMDGYANFYVSSTKQDTTYIVAVNAKGTERKDAVIPPSLYENYGIDPALSQLPYVATEMRLLNGFNVYQVVFGVIGGIIILAAIIGAVFFVFYRKQRLQLLLALKKGDRSVIEKVLGPDDEDEDSDSPTENNVQKEEKKK